ncbi:MAG: Rhs element Vgr protein [Bacteroidetes bacterium]|nr:MAG: Rhs element Vgr protein [Bacteroidota bacterium]
MAEGALTVKIKLGTEELASPQIVSVSIYNEMNRIPSAVVVFIDGDPASRTFEFSSGESSSPGKDISISMGYDLQPTELFKGVIIKHSMKVRGGSSVIILECRHKAVKMTLGRKNKVTEETASAVTEDTIIKALFSAYSVDVATNGTYIGHKGFLQYNVSDWDFMMMRAEVNGKIVYYSSKQSKFMIADPPATAPAGSVTLTYGDNIYELETEVDGRTQHKSVEASAWDSDNQALLTSSPATSALFKQLENTGVKSTDLNAIFSPAKTPLYHAGVVAKAELDSWSKGRQVKAGFAKTRGRLKTEGNATIDLCDSVTLEGLGDKFSGDVLVTGIRHELDESGWFTQIQFGLPEEWFSEKYDIHERPSSGIMAPANGLHFGKVLKIDADPAGQYRVQVKLPLIDPEGKIWARMVHDDAGNKRGHCFWPEVDDEVVVGFMNDDPRYPVILGLLFNKKAVPPIAPAAENKEKGIVTKTGIKILFNDDDGKQTLTMLTPGGNSILIDDGAKGITLKDQNGNTITMNDSGITIKSAGEVKVDATKNLTLSSASGDVSLSGTNIKNEAKAKFSANGNAGAEIQTSAIAILKGSLVKIN